MFKVNNRNSRTSCEIYSKLTIKTPEIRWLRYQASIQYLNLSMEDHEDCELQIFSRDTSHGWWHLQIKVLSSAKCQVFD